VTAGFAAFGCAGARRNATASVNGVGRDGRSMGGPLALPAGGGCPPPAQGCRASPAKRVTAPRHTTMTRLMVDSSRELCGGKFPAWRRPTQVETPTARVADQLPFADCTPFLTIP